MDAADAKWVPDEQEIALMATGWVRATHNPNQWIPPNGTTAFDRNVSFVMCYKDLARDAGKDAL